MRHRSSTAEAVGVEAACGAGAVLQLFDSALPASCAAPATTAPVFAVALAPKWYRSALLGALCAFEPPAAWQGHYRMVSAAGECHEQGDAGSFGDVAMRVEQAGLNCRIRIIEA